MEAIRKSVALTALLTLVGTAAFAQTSLRAQIRRLILQLESAGAIAGEFRGPTEILVVPPFEPARVELELDGTRVATLTSAPYRVEADLGPRAVEHTIRVVASRPGERKVSWESVINEGRDALSLRLVKRPGGRIEARVSAPADDPVVEVEFFHDVHPLGRLASPPWIVAGPPVHSGLIHATARTRSGTEASHGLTSSADVLLQTYEMRKVPIEVSVVNQSGDVLTDLDRGAFRIYDDGETTTIVGFRKVFEDPVSVALVVDASNSMSYFMKAVAKAAAGFVERTMRDEDRLSVYSIHDVPRQWQQLTSERGAVVEALGRIHAGGNTALWDALDVALRELRPETNRRAIVLLSDGEDTESLLAWNEIMKKVRLAAVPIYVIAFGPDGEAGRHADRLRYLAAETGGFVVDATTENVERAYDRIEEDLRARYALEYEVFAPTSGTEWRNVKVSVADPKWTTRSIRGYFAR